MIRCIIYPISFYIRNFYYDFLHITFLLTSMFSFKQCNINEILKLKLNSTDIFSTCYYKLSVFEKNIFFNCIYRISIRNRDEWKNQ